MLKPAEGEGRKLKGSRPTGREPGSGERAGGPAAGEAPAKQGEMVPGLGRGGGQDATARQLDRPGHLAKGHEPADGSIRAAHRSRSRTNFLSSPCQQNRCMIRETLVDGEPVLDVDTVEHAGLHLYTQVIIYSYVLIIR